MSSSNSPCAACKFLRRKCTQECVYAPYFPPDNPQRFACVHRVFGASNVAKLLNELSASQRDDAVKSLAYEAEARLRDPVYGCVGFISILQQRLRQIQTDLHNAKKELATYLSPQAMQAMQGMLANPSMIPPAGVVMPHQHHQPGNPFSPAVVFPPYGNTNVAGPPPTLVAAPHNQLVIREAQQQQELLEAQQLAAAAQREVMLRNYEQQQQDFIRFNSGGFEPVGSVAVAVAAAGGGGGGFNQMGVAGGGPAELALGTFDNVSPYQIRQQAQQGEQHHPHVVHSQQHPIEAQLLLSPQQTQGQQQQQPNQSESEDGRSVGPSC